MSFYNLDFDGSKYKDVLLFFRTQLCGCLNNTYIYARHSQTVQIEKNQNESFRKDVHFGASENGEKSGYCDCVR